MQVLWSRAARTTSCRCSSCLHSGTTTLARRTTTAAPRRRAKFGDVFTAFYSAIFATAAVADAKMKDDRRKQWDQAITEAKVGDDATSNNPRLPDPRKVLSAEVQGFKTFGERNPYKIRISNERQLMERLKVLDAHLRQSFKQDDEDVEGVDELGRYEDEGRNLGQQSRSETEKHPNITDPPTQTEIDERSCESGLPFKRIDLSNSREPNQSVHIILMERMVAELVTALLLNTRAFSTRKESTKCLSNPSTIFTANENSTPNASIDVVPESVTRSERWERLNLGLMQATRLPRYTGLDLRHEWRLERSRLEKSIQTILSSTDPNCERTDLMTAKVCYNLLVSPVPPSIEIYSLLIERFSALGDYDSAQIVIHSFFHNTRFRPDERIVLAILKHHILTNNAVAFRQTLRRMRGAEDGFRTRKRHKYTLYRQDVQEWAMSHQITVRNSTLYERAVRTAAIFDVIIRGSRKLIGLDDALRYFRASIIESQQVSAAEFSKLAKACVNAHQESFRLCRKLFLTFLLYWRQSSYVSNLITPDARACRYLYKVIKIAANIDLSFMDRPIAKFSARVKMQQPGWIEEWLQPEDCLNNMLRQIHIESQEKKLQESGRIIAGMQYAVDDYRAGMVRTENFCTETSRTRFAAEVEGSTAALDNAHLSKPLTQCLLQRPCSQLQIAEHERTLPGLSSFNEPKAAYSKASN